jgi:hypothetical protein
LNLVEAFQEFGPGVDGDTESISRQHEATTLILEALNEVCGNVRMEKADLLEEAKQTTLLRLVQVGPRGVREGDPADDEAVKGYLGQALKNNQRSSFKKIQRERAAVKKQWTSVIRAGFFEGDTPGVFVPAVDPDGEREIVERELWKAREFLHQTCIPKIASRVRSDFAKRFSQTMQDLYQISLGKLTVDEVVKREFKEVSTKTKAANYQRCCRARKTLFEQCEEVIDWARAESVSVVWIQCAMEELRNS